MRVSRNVAPHAARRSTAPVPEHSIYSHQTVCGNQVIGKYLLTSSELPLRTPIYLV